MVVRAKWLPQKIPWPDNLIFFVLAFLYLWLVVEPHLIYHCFGTILPDAPQFATGWAFLRDSLATPGGPVAYVSGFLSQGYSSAWLGAAIIVLVGVCLADLSRRHLLTAGFAHASLPAAFPAVMLFLICSRYKHPLTACLAVSLGLLLSLIFEKLPVRRPLMRIPVYCLMAMVGFWLGGGGTMLVFALLIVVYGIRARRDWTTVALALPAGAAIAWVLAEYVFLLPARQALLTLTPFAPGQTTGMTPFLKVLMSLLYGFVPLAVSLTLIAKKVFPGRKQKPDRHSKKAGGKGKHAAQRERRSLSFLKKPALSAVPVVLMALGLCVGRDELRKPYVLSNYYSRQQQWDNILELSRRLPPNRSNVYVNHDIVRALYHTGRLPYDMFRYPQIPRALLLTHERGQSDLTQLKLSDIFLELGHVNMAEKFASELLSTKDTLGVALEKLGWISIIKERPVTARVYLKALKRDLLYRKRAESLLRGLDHGFTPEQTAHIDRIRSYMIDEPVPITGGEPLDQALALLLEHNPRNKMAFEYLMACYLLTDKVDKIAANAPRLRTLGYREVPTLYQEAMAIHCGSQGRPVDLATLGISVETVRRYETFVQLARATQTQNRQAVLNTLIRDFGSSYFFYCSFGHVGAVAEK